jgi:hypothetical protein
MTTPPRRKRVAGTPVLGANNMSTAEAPAPPPPQRGCRAGDPGPGGLASAPPADAFVGADTLSRQARHDQKYDRGARDLYPELRPLVQEQST